MIEIKTTDERLDEAKGHGAYHLEHRGAEDGQDVWELTLESGPERLMLCIVGDLWIEDHKGGRRLTPAEARDAFREAWGGDALDALDVEAFMRASRGDDTGSEIEVLKARVRALETWAVELVTVLESVPEVQCHVHLAPPCTPDTDES